MTHRHFISQSYVPAVDRFGHLVIVIVSVPDVPADDLGQVREGVPRRVPPLPPVPRPLRLVLRAGGEPRRGGGEVEGARPGPGVALLVLGPRLAAADTLKRPTGHATVMLLGV